MELFTLNQRTQARCDCLALGRYVGRIRAVPRQFSTWRCRRWNRFPAVKRFTQYFMGKGFYRKLITYKFSRAHGQFSPIMHSDSIIQRVDWKSFSILQYNLFEIPYLCSKALNFQKVFLPDIRLQVNRQF